MKELKVFCGLNYDFNNVGCITFSTEELRIGYNFIISNDFKINFEETDYGYYLELTDKETLNLKQFKIKMV
jgi:hypothetical protein